VKRVLKVAGGTPLIEARAVRTVLGALKLRVEETQGSKPGRKEYEVFAPEGYNFGGHHSLVLRTVNKTDAYTEAQEHLSALERCDRDCDCGWNESEETT
jgi:hypothetical protein